MINKTKVKNLITKLELADQIEDIDNSKIYKLDWSICEVTGDPDEQAALLIYNDSPIILTERALSNARTEGNSIFCEDHEGNEVQLCLWRLQPLDCENISWPFYKTKVKYKPWFTKITRISTSKSLNSA